MPSKQLIHSLDQRKIPASSGNKALNLHRLSRNKRLVPKTYACTWDAYNRYKENDPTVLKDLKNELIRVIQPGRTYAIRSSANIEDSLERSFAGQFKTVLNVTGIEAAIRSICLVWDSVQAPNVLSYLESHPAKSNHLLMAVIIQEMVPPLYSGVALSKNPVTGADEVILEAVIGQGDQLVQGGMTPFRWINKWGYWLERSSSDEVPFILIEQLVKETREISRDLAYPVDLEWVHDGKQLFWVQVRGISALNQKNIYSNHISREYIPGMIKPLVYSVNIPLINSVWIEWISEITGDLGIQAQDLARSFFYRVYFNMGVFGRIFSGLGFPAESVEMLMGTLPYGAARPSFKPTLKTFSRLPWMMAFAISKWNFASSMKRALRRLEPRIRKSEFENLQGWSKQDLLKAIDHNYTLMKETAYYNVLGPLLMGLYNYLLGRLLSSQGVEFSQFDLTEGMVDLHDFDPANHLERLHNLLRTFPVELQEKIQTSPHEELKRLPAAREFLDQFDQFLVDFGHLSDSGNDFTTVPWRENPHMVLGMVASFEPIPRSQTQKVGISKIKASGFRKMILNLIYHRAREFRRLREEVSHLYTYGYGLFRYYYLALGRILVSDGVLQDNEDIFYLTDGEIRSIINGSMPIQPVKQIIQQHKMDMDKYKNINLPKVIFGEELPPLDNISSRVLLGVATSGGTYKGRVRIVSGLNDLDKVQAGDVIVVPYSDVSWTPLFHRAGAVIAESGGLLSHSSIVAREYNIPAVVNVEGATQLKDGTLVTVDGINGKVFIHEDSQAMEG
jgi:phosphohistidine swiveling domain-containing protein